MEYSWLTIDFLSNLGHLIVTGHILIVGLGHKVHLSTKLVSMYVVYANIIDTCLVFKGIVVFDRNIYFWNGIIKGYVRHA